MLAQRGKIKKKKLCSQKVFLLGLWIRVLTGEPACRVHGEAGSPGARSLTSGACKPCCLNPSPALFTKILSLQEEHLSLEILLYLLKETTVTNTFSASCRRQLLAGQGQPWGQVHVLWRHCTPYLMACWDLPCSSSLMLKWVRCP